jgi:uncharacterized protein YegL
LNRVNPEELWSAIDLFPMTSCKPSSTSSYLHLRQSVEIVQSVARFVALEATVRPTATGILKSSQKFQEVMAMKKELTELVFILDKSGSMGGLEKDTIGGYNSMLEKQKAIEGECHITTVLFNNNYELLHDRINIKAVSKITENEYAVGGSTALLDAIGMTIHKTGNAQKHTSEDYQAEKVIFVIITDGEENSSREYSAQKIKAQIERQKVKYGWEFIFLGANIDAVETAARFGISEDRAQNYHADSEGVELNFRVMSEAVASFRESSAMPEGWNDEIQEDYKKRGGQK